MIMEETTASTGTLTTLTGDNSFQTPRSIPFDLATEILSKLSVKFLLKFSTTCKSWNSLIHDPKFVKKHLRISTKRHNLITTTCIPYKKFTVMSYPLHSLPFNSIFNVNATQYEYSPIKLDYHDRLVASCDGIICFAITQNLAVLWNPSIGKLKTLPTLETPKDGDDDGHTVYGFGYDPFVDNYKVVSVFYYNVYACKTEVSVYTFGTDCWRRIEDFPPLIPYSQQGVFVCGTVNWLAYYDLNDNDYYRSYAIVSLDLETETYHEISQPDYGEVIEKLTLTLLRDCLCVFSHSDSFDDVWVMKEFGNDESWIKLIRIPGFSNRCLYFDNHKILYVFDDDNHVLLLMEEKFKLKWVVYDSKNDIVKSTKFQDFSWVESKVYVESLLSP
jgi:F-box interacting protein